MPLAHYTEKDATAIGKILEIDFVEIPLEEFRKGLNIEREHGRVNPVTDITHDDDILTGKIALAHLNKYPDYYTRLEKMVEEAKAFWRE